MAVINPVHGIFSNISVKLFALFVALAIWWVLRRIRRRHMADAT